MLVDFQQKKHGFDRHAESTAPIWRLPCPTEAKNMTLCTDKSQIRIVVLENTAPDMKIYSASMEETTAQLDYARTLDTDLGHIDTK